MDLIKRPKRAKNKWKISKRAGEQAERQWHLMKVIRAYLSLTRRTLSTSCEAAREFQSDYKGWTRDINGSVTERAIQILVDVIPKYPVYLINGDDEAKEYQQIKAMGDGLYPQFFIDSLGTGTRTQPCAELLALYDDRVHDSRARFMQSSLGGREPWAVIFATA